MRVVIYTEMMEPITVINLDLREGGLFRRLVRDGADIRVAYSIPPSFLADEGSLGVSLNPCMQIVRLRPHLMMVPGPSGRPMDWYFFTTQDEATAMLLEAVFLPGQQGTLRERERAAMARGFLRGLQAQLGSGRDD